MRLREGAESSEGCRRVVAPALPRRRLPLRDVGFISMLKMLTTGGLSVVLLRAADLYMFHGRYTDAAMLMLREIRRSFGL